MIRMTHGQIRCFWPKPNALLFTFGIVLFFWTVAVIRLDGWGQLTTRTDAPLRRKWKSIRRFPVQNFPVTRENSELKDGYFASRMTANKKPAPLPREPREVGGVGDPDLAPSEKHSYFSDTGNNGSHGVPFPSGQDANVPSIKRVESAHSSNYLRQRGNLSRRRTGNHKLQSFQNKYVPDRPSLTRFFRSRKPVSAVNCRALIHGSNADGYDTTPEATQNLHQSSLLGEDYAKLAKNCPKFKSSRGYITAALSEEERGFPIAYSILMFKDIEQTERLLRAIYQPQNYYCIHVDTKSSATIKKGMTAIANCFDNVFVLRHAVDVRWGTFTVLEPELLCMQELWAYKKWKYFINLTGQEFPLKTNLELVKILSAYKGANNLEGTRERANTDRWNHLDPPPHNIIPTKGSVHVTVSRGFVDYVLHNQTAKDFLEWVKQTSVPDETFFSTLNHNPQLGVPGAYKGRPETDKKTYPFLTRYKIWSYNPNPELCQGQLVRAVCVFGVRDLPRLTSQPHLFANKFHWDYEHYARDCLEEWHFNKTRDKFLYKSEFDVSYYNSLSFVRSKVDR